MKSSNPQKDVVKWIRINGRFKSVSYKGSEILYLREKENKAAKRVLSTEELFEKLEGLHKVEGDHTGRTRLYKRASEEFYGITEWIYAIFVKTCQVCYLKK